MNILIPILIIITTICGVIYKHWIEIEDIKVQTMLVENKFDRWKVCQDVAVCFVSDDNIVYDGYIYAIQQIDRVGDQLIVIKLNDVNCNFTEEMHEYINVYFDSSDKKYKMRNQSGQMEEVNITELIAE